MPKPRSRRTHFQSSVHPENNMQELHVRGRSQPTAPCEAMHNVRLDMDNDAGVVTAVQQRSIPKDLMQKLPSRNRPSEPAFEKQRSNSLKRRSSHNSSYGTLRRLRNMPASVYNEMGTDGVANLLEMESQAHDVEEPELRHREALRDLNFPLTQKRKVRDKLASKQKNKQKKLGWWQYRKYTWSMQWQHFKTSVKDLRFSLEPWHRPMREIEGNQGSGVASYFYFLRWLLGLNILTSAIICLFVVLPQALSHLPEVEWYPVNGVTLHVTPSKSDLNPMDFLTGGGWFENKLLYFGAYISALFRAWGHTWYNLPLAYLLGFGATMVVTLVFIAYSLAKSHKKYYIEQSGLTGNYFFNKVFCGWDFAITNEKAAQLQSKALQLDLKEQLASLIKMNKEETIADKCLTICRYIIFNLLSFVVLGGIGYLVYYLLDTKNDWNKKSVRSDSQISEMFLSLIITAITLTLPALFSATVKFEGYKSHRTQLRVAMFRSMLLILLVIGCPLYFWIDPRHSTMDDSSVPIRPSNASTTAASFYSTNIGVKKEECWETEVGKELYRFVIVDFLVCVLLYFPVSWLRSIFHRHGIRFLGNLEFDVVWNTWNLLYNQAICWIGAFFSPLLPVIIVIKLIITFYVRKLSVMHHFQPPTRVWRAHRNRTDFRIVTFAIVVLSMLGIGYVIVKPKPSRVCGPFQGQKNSYEIVFWVMNSFDDTEWLGHTASFLTKPGCVTLLILTLCCLAYYARAVAKARLKMVQLLQDQVKLEGKDKVFLLRMYESALNSWYNRPNDGRGDVRFGSSTVLPNEDINGEYRRWSQADLNRNVPPARFNNNDRAAARFQNSESSVSQTNSHSAEQLHRQNLYGDGIADEKAVTPRNIYNPPESFQMDNSQRMSPYSPQFHHSTESITSPVRRDFPPFSAGAINPVYRDDSPSKSHTPPPSKRFRDPIQPFPGITHQPPFQNLGMNRRLSKGASAEDIRTDSKRRLK